jgi:hypothetical protein
LTLNFFGFIRDGPLRPRHQRSIDAFFKSKSAKKDRKNLRALRFFVADTHEGSAQRVIVNGKRP